MPTDRPSHLGIVRPIDPKTKVDLLRAIDGPFDGEELAFSLGVSELMTPARFATNKNHNYRGLVIYRRVGTEAHFIGQPDQTDAIAEEMKSREGGQSDVLILP